MRGDAEKAFRAQLLLDSIAEKEQVSVGQQELVEYLIASAQQYRMEPNEFVKAVDEAGQITQMVAEVGRRKALAQVLERAQVKDESGNSIDLEAIFPKSEETAGEAGPDEEFEDDGQDDGQASGVEQAPAPSRTVSAASDPTALPSF